MYFSFRLSSVGNQYCSSWYLRVLAPQQVYWLRNPTGWIALWLWISCHVLCRLSPLNSMQMSTSSLLLRSQKVVALDLLEDGFVVCLAVSGNLRSTTCGCYISQQAAMQNFYSSCSIFWTSVHHVQWGSIWQFHVHHDLCFFRVVITVGPHCIITICRLARIHGHELTLNCSSGLFILPIEHCTGNVLIVILQQPCHR